jgi:tRNA-2-methylthio-N6-dimethylallyladenosine synthase
MNVYDGERMAESAEPTGSAPRRRGADADLVVLNTCHIREKAAEKVYSDIGRLRRDGRPHAADRRRRLRRPGRGRGDHGARAPVRMVVGPQAYHRCPRC